MSDEKLWAAFQAGDESALAEIDRRWRTHLVEYTLHRVGDEQRATEIVNDVFQRLAGYNGPMGSVRAMLFRTAHSWTGATCHWMDRMPILIAEAPVS